MKKVLLVLGLGLGLSTAVGAKEPGDGPNCFRLYTMCADGHQVSCDRFDRYC
jgi:hypothetical protein